MDWSSIEARLSALPAKIGFFYRNLDTGEVYSYRGNTVMYAASVIKLFILGTAHQAVADGELTFETEYTLRREVCVPSCGALTYMHDGLVVTVRDLCNLMVILSDNTATNCLIDLLGEDKINRFIREQGFRDTCLRRKMYDWERARKGIQNTITAEEVGTLLTRMYRGELVSPQASAEMVAILKEQQLNHKIPFYLQSQPDCPEIAHKTGEDDGITHDVGIVFTKTPFVVCFTFNDAAVPDCERAMGELSLEIAREHMV